MNYPANNTQIALIIKSSLFFLRKENKLSCLIINPGRLAEELYLDPKINLGYEFYKFENLYLLEDISLIRQELEKYDLILFDQTGEEIFGKTLLETLNELKLKEKKIYSLTSFFESVTGRIPLINIKKEDWLLNEDLFFVSNRWHFYFFKRFSDIVITMIILPFALFVASIAMILIKFSSPGPAMFKQKRVGKNGVPFTMYKLRTMVFSQAGHKQYTVKNDSRIFPVGKVLRLSKIDELPQLYNVLLGDMSLIGPRPEKVDIVESLSKENPYYPLRHTIKPGITGWAQVNNPTATPDENLQKLEFDLFYVKNASYFLELIILLKTIKVVLKRESL